MLPERDLTGDLRIGRRLDGSFLRVWPERSKCSFVMYNVAKIHSSLLFNKMPVLHIIAFDGAAWRERYANNLLLN